jgi:thioredoxin 1
VATRIAMKSNRSLNWPGLVAAVVVAAVAVVAVLQGTTAGLSQWPPAVSQSGAQDMLVKNAKTAVQHANDGTFDEMVLKSDVPVLVDFYADWCGPCQRLAPVLEELAAEDPGARIVKVNVDHSPVLAGAYRINSIPSLIVFKNGVAIEQLTGLASKSQLRAMLGR